MRPTNPSPCYVEIICYILMRLSEGSSPLLWKIGFTVKLPWYLKDFLTFNRELNFYNFRPLFYVLFSGIIEGIFLDFFCITCPFFIFEGKRFSFPICFSICHLPSGFILRFILEKQMFLKQLECFKQLSFLSCQFSCNLLYLFLATSYDHKVVSLLHSLHKFSSKL